MIAIQDVALLFGAEPAQDSDCYGDEHRNYTLLQNFSECSSKYLSGILLLSLIIRRLCAIQCKIFDAIERAIFGVRGCLEYRVPVATKLRTW